MSNPQCENGYTKIANEIFDALIQIRIPGEARKVFDFIIRKTWGYHKKEDYISLSQFQIATKISKSNICEALNKLRKMNLIIITQLGKGIVNKYKINKDIDTWKPLPKKIIPLPKTIIPITQLGNTFTQLGNNHYPKPYIQKKVLKDNLKEINTLWGHIGF